MPENTEPMPDEAQDQERPVLPEDDQPDPTPIGVDAWGDVERTGQELMRQQTEAEIWPSNPTYAKPMEDDVRPWEDTEAADLAANPAPPFLVKVTTDGGAAGDVSTPCTWTYAVTTMSGARTILTGATPLRARTAVGAYTYAPDASRGLACWDSAEGEYVLLDAYGEVPVAEACP